MKNKILKILQEELGVVDKTIIGKRHAAERIERLLKKSPTWEAQKLKGNFQIKSPLEGGFDREEIMRRHMRRTPILISGYANSDTFRNFALELEGLNSDLHRAMPIVLTPSEFKLIDLTCRTDQRFSHIRRREGRIQKHCKP